jgi:sugar O-acyltransferase (sialic acid O-acetyltransferase NeuD family)
MKKIAIVGCGGFGREVKMLIDQINSVTPLWDFVGYFDDGFKEGSIINGSEVIGDIKNLNSYNGVSELYLAIAIGNPKIKKNIINIIDNPIVKFATLIHPNALIGKDSVTIAEGCIIAAGVIITVNITIEKYVILNLSCTVGHDTTIRQYSSFMPSVNISGEVEILEGVYVGTGSKIINQLTIGEWTTIGAGAVVSKSIPPFCTAVGIPAKPIKFHNE